MVLLMIQSSIVTQPNHLCHVGFVSMGTVPYAHIVAKAYEGKPQEGAEISLAPNPKDIVRLDIQAVNSAEKL